MDPRAPGRTSPGIAFDAVLFDLDGTLVATDRFWVQAARTGARRAFAELGLSRALPSAEAWMSLVGQPLAGGFERLFADLSHAERETVLARCLEEEHALLGRGGAALVPGARDLLAGLCRAGLQLGIASNCSQRYLDHMLLALGLSELVHASRCLESPGVTCKADMIEQLLEHFQTRAAVFVGDRSSDRDAAWANGLPHVHCAFGFAPSDESVQAEAVIGDLLELECVLARRANWIASALERAGFLRKTLGQSPILGITGEPCAGKSLFARDAVAALARRGYVARVLELERFQGASPRAARSEDPLAQVLDLAVLERLLLAPRARGEEVVLPGGGAESLDLRIGPAELIVLEGAFLLDPRLRPHLARVIHLSADEDTLLRRAAGCAGRTGGEGALERFRGSLLSSQRAFERAYPSERHADLVVDASNALGS